MVSLATLKTTTIKAWEEGRRSSSSLTTRYSQRASLKRPQLTMAIMSKL